MGDRLERGYASAFQHFCPCLAEGEACTHQELKTLKIFDCGKNCAVIEKTMEEAEGEKLKGAKHGEKKKKKRKS